MWIQDNWAVFLPGYLREEGKYTGDIIIDQSGELTAVRLEEFCLVAKIAAIFYAKYFDPTFRPYDYFLPIDQMCQKYALPR